LELRKYYTKFYKILSHINVSDWNKNYEMVAKVYEIQRLTREKKLGTV
jgi:hypothetical protein